MLTLEQQSHRTLAQEIENLSAFIDVAPRNATEELLSHLEVAVVQMRQLADDVLHESKAGKLGSRTRYAPIPMASLESRLRYASGWFLERAEFGAEYEAVSTRLRRLEELARVHPWRK